MKNPMKAYGIYEPIMFEIKKGDLVARRIHAIEGNNPKTIGLVLSVVYPNEHPRGVARVSWAGPDGMWIDMALVGDLRIIAKA